ncbi:MAG: Ig-like domain-containing protein, partial [Planctomycetales bacterium]
MPTRMTPTRSIICLTICLLLPTIGAAEDTIVVLPQSFALGSPQSTQQLLVERTDENQNNIGEAEGEIVWGSSDLSVVKVVAGAAYPTGDGKATITATWNGRTATTEARVNGLKQPQEWEFRRHILPVLAKQGCNSGSCHGALAGKGEFKLSLRGYDPATDHWSITRQARGRRIEMADPGRSLVLAKPSGGIPHKGGLRFETDSLDYKVLAEWITAGAPPPQNNDPKLVALDVLPKQMVLKPDDQQQLIVQA